jgi:hypothetical protein
MLKMFWRTEGGKLVGQWKDVPVKREKATMHLPCQPLPEPQGARC